MRRANSTARAILLGIGMLPGIASADPAQHLFKSVLDNARLCSYQSNDAATRTDCLIKAAPQKCEAEARKFLATQNRELFFCVASCVNAGFTSRSFGECSRKLDREDAGAELAAIVRQAEQKALNFYWDQAGKANAVAYREYPYLETPATELDKKAASNFEFLKKQYLTVGANSYQAVIRAAQETDQWRAGRLREASMRSWVAPGGTSPSPGHPADSFIQRSNAPASEPPPAYGNNCQIKPVMTNDDLAACGITPPSQ